MQHAAMPLTRKELDHFAASTLAHYDERAEDYWQGTRDHDVSQNVATLLRHIERAAPLSILDLGCGPGRDLKTFSELGHKAIGLEGAPQVGALARAHSGCVVWEQNLLALNLPTAEFGGVFANAVPTSRQRRAARGQRLCALHGRPLPRRVHQGQDPHGFARKLVHQAIVFVRDQLAGACNLAGVTKLRMVGKPGRRVAE